MRGYTSAPVNGCRRSSIDGTGSDTRRRPPRTTPKPRPDATRGCRRSDHRTAPVARAPCGRTRTTRAVRGGPRRSLPSLPAVLAPSGFAPPVGIVSRAPARFARGDHDCPFASQPYGTAATLHASRASASATRRLLRRADSASLALGRRTTSGCRRGFGPSPFAGRWPAHRSAPTATDRVAVIARPVGSRRRFSPPSRPLLLPRAEHRSRNGSRERRGTASLRLL